MRILYVAPKYYPHIGGVEYVVKSLATRFAKMGHQVTVLCGEPGTISPKEEELNNVWVIRWPTFAPNNAYHVPRRKAEFEKLSEELAKTHDIAHIHSAHAVLPVQVGLKLKQYNPGLRLVFTPHYHGAGHTLARRLLWSIFWWNKINKLTRIADTIHSVSPYEAQLLQKHYPHIKHKIVVIPNGVDEDVLNHKWRGVNSDYMIYAGRIEKYKRLELAVDVARLLGLKLVVLGEGPYEKGFKKYVEKHYPEKVKFLALQPRQKYLDLLAKARYAINLSEYEAFSIFIAEALAMGTPCIISKTISKNLNIEEQGTNRLFDEIYLLHKAIVFTWSTIATNVNKYVYSCNKCT